MTIEEFLQEYGEDIRSFEKEDDADFNIFQVLGLERYEIRHSSFLVWLLKNQTFRAAFFNKACAVQEESAKKLAAEHADIDTEQSFTEVDEKGDPVYLIWEKKANKKVLQVFQKGNDEKTLYQRTQDGSNEGYSALEEDTDLFNAFRDERKKYEVKGNKRNQPRKIDLNMIGQSYTLTIENKVDSEQHDNQCIAYRHYMNHCETYQGKKHYYVFLAPEEPEDFKSEIYKDYSFINYESIVEILDSMLKDEEWIDLQKDIVKQYIKIIQGWKSFPEKYQKVFEEIDIAPFADENYTKTVKLTDQMTGQQKRFVFYARQYYLMIKAKTDEEILSVLQEISKDRYFIKEDYGRGNYAKAIPVSAEVLKGKERYQYFPDTKIITEKEYGLKLWEKDSTDQKCKAIESRANNKLEKEKNQKVNQFPFQTVDYCAPRGKYKHPSIHIACGVNVPQAKKLCSSLAKDGKTAEIAALKSIGWTIEAKLGCKSGAGEGGRTLFEMTIDADTLAGMSKDVFRNTDINDKHHINGKLWALDIFSAAFWDYLKKLKEYVPEKTIEFGEELLHRFVIENQESLRATIQFLTDKGLMGDDQIQTKQKPLPFTKIEELIGRELSAEEKKSIENQCKLQQIKNKLKEDWDNLDKRRYKAFTVLWQLTLDYEVKEGSLQEVFREKTLEGVRPFGLEEFFRDTIFKDPSGQSEQA